MVATDRGGAWDLPAGPRFADSFREAFQSLLDHWTEVFRTLRVPVPPVSTARPAAEQIRLLFGQRHAVR